MNAAMVKTLGRCPVCGGTRLRKLPAPGHWIGEEVFGDYEGQFALSRCLECSLVFVNPAPSQELLERFYSGDNYSCHQPNATTPARRGAEFVLALLREYLPPSAGRRLLDFGCGGGSFLEVAVQQGWEAIGYDVGPSALKACSGRGLHVVSRLEECAPASFDAITLNHVFEHLEDPGTVLQSLKHLLTAEGRLLIEVPNWRSLRARLSLPLLSRHFGFDERFRAFPIHLSYFTRSSLELLLRQNGFRIEKSTTVGFGLEELIRRGPDKAPTPATRGLAEPQPRLNGKNWVKQQCKKWFFRLGWGENLLVIAAVGQRPA